MSYSFVIRAANKDAAIIAVGAELEKVVKNWEQHKHDAVQALNAANAQINLLADDNSKDIQVSCNGYLSIETVGGAVKITSAGVGCTASLANRIAPPVAE